MAATVFACPGCKSKYPWRNELAGRKLKCKKCGHTFQIKTKRQPAAAPAQTSAAAPVASAVVAAEPVGASLGSLLDEELAAGLASPAPASTETAPNEEEAKRPCPLCEHLVEAGRERCPICKTRMDRPLSDPEAERRKEESREWMFVLAGLGGALLATPLLFLAIVLLFGKNSGPFAMVVCAIEVNYIVAIGCFALACRVFRQEPPEIIDILRTVAYATLSSKVIVSWIGGAGLLSALAATGVAAVIAAVICMTQLEMPVFPSIFVAFTYNVFATIFTVIGVVLLGLCFAGYLIGTGTSPMSDDLDTMEIEEEDTGYPGGDEEEFDGDAMPDDSEARAPGAAIPWATAVALGFEVKRPGLHRVTASRQATVNCGRGTKSRGNPADKFQPGLIVERLGA